MKSNVVYIMPLMDNASNLRVEGYSIKDVIDYFEEMGLVDKFQAELIKIREVLKRNADSQQ